MTATATMNGRPQRKQLADQLDRLDSIIDTLAEGLPGAVADACREGARAAVKDAIIEILSNPDLRAMLVPPHPPSPAPLIAPPELVPAPEPKPSLWTRLKMKLAAMRDALVGATQKAKERVTTRYAAAKDAVIAVGNATGETLPLKQISLVALSVGVVVGVACLVVPHTVSATVSGVTAAATAIAVQTGTWLRNAARRFGLLS